MDLKRYEPIITVAEQNVSQASLLGMLSNNLMEGREIDLVLPNIDSRLVHEYLNLDGKIAFRENYISEYFYACFLLDVNSKKNNLIPFLVRMTTHPLKLGSKNVGYNFLEIILINASRLYDVDIAQLVVQRKSTLNHRFRNAFIAIIPFLKPSAFFIEALTFSIQDIKPDDGYNSIYHSLKVFSSNSFDTGISIFNHFKNVPEKCVLVIPSTFLGLSEAVGLTNTFSLLQDLFASNEKYKKIAAVRCVGMLHGNTFKLDDFQHNIEEEFSRIIDQGDSECLTVVINTYGILVDKLANAANELLRIINKYDNPQVSIVLSHVLWINSKDNVHKTWYRDCLMRLTSFDTEYLAVYHNLDMAFMGIEQNNVGLVYGYLERFIIFQKDSHKTIEGFKSVIERLARSNYSLFQKKFTEWLNSDNDKFHLVIERVASMLFVRGRKQIILDKEILDSLTFDDMKFILFKIVGYIHNKEYLESLVFSSLKKQKIETQHLKLVIELFSGHIVFNYPSALEFLKAKKSNANSNELKVIDAIIERTNGYFVGRKERLNELAPSSDRQQIFFNQMTKQYNDNIQLNKYKEPSIFDFVKNITLKTGNAFFSRVQPDYLNEKLKQKSELQHYESSFAMPSGEFIDPVGQAYRRIVWRSYKRKGQ